MTTNDTTATVDAQLAEMETKVTCALGGPLSDADKAAIDGFGELLRVMRQVKALHGKTPFDLIARKRAELGTAGAFGRPDRKPWADRDRSEQRIATTTVYEVMVAALAAGVEMVIPPTVWQCRFCDTNNELDKTACRTCDHTRAETELTTPAPNPDQGATP